MGIGNKLWQFIVFGAFGEMSCTLEFHNTSRSSACRLADKLHVSSPMKDDEKIFLWLRRALEVKLGDVPEKFLDQSKSGADDDCGRWFIYIGLF